ncbi:uncharacterized protein IL334_006425 [Kwoniella shivajii]|uniref:Cell cycle checkpoint control protein RAD9A n=1 Tax=Kwoniella shivajii TaxID=564305 RepID=A0ABZ1D802_9TREE|nr:hypothetical protein IL334_006425 [Kwoniella shivajii]
MDASVKGENIKTFMRLLQCAAKYGDDLNIHATSKIWEMSATNSSKSAFCLFKLDKSFFCRWDHTGSRGVKCRLLVKSVLVVLGKQAQINTVNRLDLKIIDPSNDLHPPQHRKRGERNTTISSTAGSQNGHKENAHRVHGDEDDYSDDEDARMGIEAKLIVRLVCKHGVTKKHSLHLGASDFLRADVDPNTTPSGFVIATRTLRDWLDNFAISSGSAYPGNSTSGGTDQLGWMFTKNEVRMKSWEGMGGGGLCTEIKVDTEEFQDYEVVGDRVDLTLPMKEFRGTLMLAEQLSATLNVSFSTPGQPLTLTSLDEEFENFSIFCAIATTACEAFTDTRSSPVDIKRSDSDAPQQQLPPPPARTDSQMSTSSNRKRKGSEAPSQSRKRSSLNLAPAQETMIDVYLPLPTNASSGPSKSQQQQELDNRRPRPDHVSASQEDTRSQVHTGPIANATQNVKQTSEPLFIPGGSQRLGSQENHTSPQKSQVVRMSQQQLLEAAGLDIDFDEALNDAALEDEKEMEEEFSRSQLFQEGYTEEVQERAGQSSNRQSPHENPISPNKSNNPSPPKSTDEVTTSGDKSKKSHASWVVDSHSDETTDHSGLIWDSTIDNPSNQSVNRRSPSKGQLSPKKRSSSPVKQPSLRNSRSPSKGQASSSKGKTKMNDSEANPDDDEFDELANEEEEDATQPQSRPGSIKKVRPL